MTIEISIQKEGGDRHVITPFAWIDWPAVLLENAWNDIKAAFSISHEGTIRDKTYLFPCVYERLTPEECTFRDEQTENSRKK